jgi:hypothetical protein
VPAPARDARLLAAMSDTRSTSPGPDVLDSNDLVLLILGAPASSAELQDRCNGITRLEKLAFLLEHQTDFAEKVQTPAEALDFRAYHYGPYSQAVYDAVGLLAGIGLVTDRRVNVSSRLESGEELESMDWGDLGASGSTDRPYVERQIELTEKGKLVVGLLRERVGEEALRQITEVKDRFGTMPLRGLLRYVYDRYPEMAAESRIRDTL